MIGIIVLYFCVGTGSAAIHAHPWIDAGNVMFASVFDLRAAGAGVPMIGAVILPDIRVVVEAHSGAGSSARHAYGGIAAVSDMVFFVYPLAAFRADPPMLFAVGHQDTRHTDVRHIYSGIWSAAFLADTGR